MRAKIHIFPETSKQKMNYRLGTTLNGELFLIHNSLVVLILPYKNNNY